MASGRIQGITIEISGDTVKLQDSLKDVDKSLRDTQSKLKDVNKLLKLDPKNTELLSQKQDALKKAIADSRLKVVELNKTLGEMGERNSKNAESYDAIQREIIQCQQQQQQWTAQLKDMEPHVMSIKEKFEDIANKTAAVGEKFKSVGEGVSNVGKTLTTSVSAPIVGFFTLASKGASDLEENLNKVDVAFGNDAQTVKSWADNATAQFGLSKNAALEAASLFGDMGTAMGLTTGDAAEMSTNLAGLAGDLSSFKNIDVEQAMNALKGVFTGETESLKGLGIIMNQTNLKQFAEDTGLVYDELSQAELVTLRYNYVLENTKNAAGDYARTSDGTANSIRTLQATVSNLTAELGTALLPIITPIIQKITEFAQSFAGLDEGTKNTIVTVGLVIAAIGPLLTVIGTVISTIGTIMTMAPALSAAIGALSGPIGLVVVAIAGAIAAGIALWKNWDTVKIAVAKLYVAIQTAFQNILSTATTIFNNLRSTISSIVSSISSTVSSVFNNIRSTVTGIVSSISSTVSSVFGSIPGAISGAIGGVVGIVSGVFDNVRSTISNAINGAKDTVLGAVNSIKGAFNFSWSLPRIQLPHFSVSTGKFGLPNISVQWYKKAYDDPIIFKNPTVLATAAGFKGFGDGAGAEMVIGMNKLRDLVASSQGDTNQININVYAAQGMSETAVANAVALRLDRWLGERV
jgi:phage-related minor tail protein